MPSRNAVDGDPGWGDELQAEFEPRDQVDEKVSAEVEARIMDHQEEVIRAEHGEDAARLANYGQLIDGGDSLDAITVHTKVYGVGRVSTRLVDDDQFVDDWSPL